jgi:hypothetical protein
MNELTTADRELLTAALRSHYCSAADTANGFDRAYGAADGRAREAWRKAHETQAALRALADKFALPL